MTSILLDSNSSGDKCKPSTLPINMNFTKKVIRLINKLPYVRGLYKENVYLRNRNVYLKKENNRFTENACFPAGHFYSPIILVADIKKRENDIWDKAKIDGVSSIELNALQQIKLIQDIAAYYDEMPFKFEKQPDIRYYFNNDYYSYTDGIVLYAMMRHFKPKRIIEIGSGYSSAVMLDTNNLFFNNEIDLTFIEPYPERLLSLMNDNDKKSLNIIKSDVQNVSLEIFKTLQARDILFIDSTHVVKTGSDVNCILFDILPILPKGVLIHFHDIYYPFEYPKHWVLEGRNWNECYFLRAFLMYNHQFEILLFSQYIHKHHKEAFKYMPLCYKNKGGSLWLEKK